MVKVKGDLRLSSSIFIYLLTIALLGAGGDVYADTVRLVARYQQAVSEVPGASIYQVLGYLGSEAPLVSGSDKVLLKAKLQGQGITVSGADALLVEDSPGQLRLLARGLDPITVPGASDARFQSFSSIKIAENGRSLFRAQILATGATSTNNSLLCISDVGSPRCLIRSGTAGIVSFSEELPQVGNDLLTFKSSGSGTLTALRAWDDSTDSLVTIAQLGALAPDAGGATFGPSIPKLYTRGSSVHVVSGTLSGGSVSTSNDVGIWQGTASNLSLFVREGDPVPGKPGAFFTSLIESGSPPVVNAAGVVAFTGAFSGATSGRGVFRLKDSQIEPLFFSGDSAAAELGAGIAFAENLPTLVSNNVYLADDQFGTAFVVAEVVGPGVNATNSRTIWRFGPGGRELIARGGQEVEPGIALDNSQLGKTVRTNSSQEIAIRTNVNSSGGNSTAILRSEGTRLRVLARASAGQTIISGGESYRLITPVWNPMLQYNELGQVLFEGTTANDPLDPNGRPSLIVADQNGQLHLVTGHEHFFEVQPTGESIRLGSYSYSETHALSDSGDVVFAATIAFGPNGNQAVFRHRIEVTTSCPADFNRDGVASPQDLYDFLAAFFTPDLSADTDGSGHIGVEDLFQFLENWFMGCS